MINARMTEGIQATTITEKGAVCIPKHSNAPQMQDVRFLNLW